MELEVTNSLWLSAIDAIASAVPLVLLSVRAAISCRKKVLSVNYDLKHLEDELQFCALILSYSPKNESTWSHRYMPKIFSHLNHLNPAFCCCKTMLISLCLY
jgi:hypothetical protein